MTLNGTYEFSSGNNTLLFVEPNGTFTYNVTLVPTGFVATPDDGRIVVDGARVNFTVAFNVTPSGPSSPTNVLGLPPAEGYGAIGGILAAAIIGIVLARAFARRTGHPPG